MAEGASYQLVDGTVGQVRGPEVAPADDLATARLAQSFDHQLRVKPRGDRTVVAFHQEHLPGAKEREERRAHYTLVLDELEHMTRP